MKATVHSSKCASAPLAIAPAQARHAPHVPARRPIRRATQRPFSPRPIAPDLPTVGGTVARPGPGVPRVLHVDGSSSAADMLFMLLVPEAQVVHAATLADAQRLLRSEVFSLIVLDPMLPDGDGVQLLAELASTPMLVYCEQMPAWREASHAYLPKPWTSHRQLWLTISGLLGLGHGLSAGD
ncbi:MAG: hypothetical protein V4463_22835 [Pseudomonadota bacterium]